MKKRSRSSQEAMKMYPWNRFSGGYLVLLKTACTGALLLY